MGPLLWRSLPMQYFGLLFERQNVDWEFRNILTRKISSHSIYSVTYFSFTESLDFIGLQPRS